MGRGSLVPRRPALFGSERLFFTSGWRDCGEGRGPIFVPVHLKRERSALARVKRLDGGKAARSSCGVSWLATRRSGAAHNRHQPCSRGGGVDDRARFRRTTKATMAHAAAKWTRPAAVVPGRSRSWEMKPISATKLLNSVAPRIDLLCRQTAETASQTTPRPTATPEAFHGAG